MIETNVINAPHRPLNGERATYVSVFTRDVNVTRDVQRLFDLFTAKYTNDNPLAAFFEWIVAQLPEIVYVPYITVSDTAPAHPKQRPVCEHQDDCMHFVESI